MASASSSARARDPAKVCRKQDADQRTASENHRRSTLDCGRRGVGSNAQSPLSTGEIEQHFAAVRRALDLARRGRQAQQGLRVSNAARGCANEADIVDRQVEALRIVAENAAGQVLHAKGRVNDTKESFLSFVHRRYRRRITVDRQDQQKAGLPAGFLGQDQRRRGRRCASRARALGGASTRAFAEHVKAHSGFVTLRRFGVLDGQVLRPRAWWAERKCRISLGNEVAISTNSREERSTLGERNAARKTDHLKAGETLGEFETGDIAMELATVDFGRAGEKALQPAQHPFVSIESFV